MRIEAKVNEMNAVPELSVVSPCYNEELTVESCVERLFTALQDSQISFEHILVDNSSTDDTLQVLMSLRDRYPHIRVLSNEFNIGAFRSMQRGIVASKGKLIVPFLAADCQDPPELIPKMIEIRMMTGSNTVAGVRRVRHDGLVLALFRKLFYRIVSLATSGRYKSGTSEFRLMESTSAMQLAQIQDATPFLRIYMAQIQGRVQYIEYEMADRLAGESSTSFLPLVDDALNGIMLAAPSMFSRLMVALAPCVMLSCLTVAFGTAATVLGSKFGPTVLVVGTLGTIVSVLFSLQAAIGHYVYMIHSQVRSGPSARTVEL